MRIYRGPSSKPFYDESNELVAIISPDEIEKCISNSRFIEFNVTKDGAQRQSNCQLVIEDEDVIPMIRALTSRLRNYRPILRKIDDIVEDESQSNDVKLTAIQSIISEAD